MEVGEEGGRLYTYRYSVTTNNGSCITMGSDESNFNVSLIVRDKVTVQCPQTTTFEQKESRSGFEPASLCAVWRGFDLAHV